MLSNDIKKHLLEKKSVFTVRRGVSAAGCALTTTTTTTADDRRRPKTKDDDDATSTKDGRRRVHAPSCLTITTRDRCAASPPLRGCCQSVGRPVAAGALAAKRPCPPPLAARAPFHPRDYARATATRLPSVRVGSRASADQCADTIVVYSNSSTVCTFTLLADHQFKTNDVLL